MKAIRILEPGGPEKLTVADVAIPEPGSGEVLVRIAAAGVNFIDIYQRMGLYPIPCPFTPGLEGAGTVEALGKGVTEVRPGDRVSWYASAPGSYADYVVVPASLLVPIPEGVDLKMAASAMLQGMTAHYLTHSAFPLDESHTCLVHAAAGGTGMLIVQMARKLGATVIGTTSTVEKAQRAIEAGCNEVILYTQTDFDKETRHLTDGRGVDVVFDSVGKSTWEKSLNSLRPRGTMVSFGNASGPVDPFPPLTLSAKGSLFLTRPKLQDYIATHDELDWRAGDVLRWVEQGSLRITIDHEYRLDGAREAQEALASRKTSGKLLLIP